MKQKTVPVPGLYELEEISISEISQALNHHFDRDVIDNLTDENRFKNLSCNTILVNRFDLRKLVEISNGTFITFITVMGLRMLKIDFTDDLKKNEIAFIADNSLIYR